VEKVGGKRNVYENKGTYLLKAGIYMKTGRLMFSAEVSQNMLSDSPPRRGLIGLDSGRCTAKKFFFLNEQCGNVYENKGPLWKSGPEAGMCMKIKAVTCQ
jgi:hypothetical protein